MLKPVYFAFVKTMLEFFLQTTHFVTSPAHSPRLTSKIIARIALRRAILMKANRVVSLHAHRLFSGRACSCKKDPCWPLTVYLNSTRKGCTLGTSSSCVIIVDQLRKQRRPRFSPFLNTGRQWHGKYCFASRGEQIIGGYRRTITFLNIPEI